jgi:hypothetical protein
MLSYQDSLNFKYNELLEQGMWKIILLSFQSHIFLPRKSYILKEFIFSRLII